MHCNSYTLRACIELATAIHSLKIGGGLGEADFVLSRVLLLGQTGQASSHRSKPGVFFPGRHSLLRIPHFSALLAQQLRPQ